MSQAIYRWHGNLFCKGCIVGTMLDHEPWNALEDTIHPTAGLHEHQLQQLADHFGYDRAVPVADFPQRVTEVPQSPCMSCFNWFH